MIHLIAQIAGIIALVLFVLAIVCIALAERAPIMEDIDGSAGGLPDAQARPEEAERPTLPPQIIVHLALSDRMDKRAKATPEELEALKLAITRARDRMAVHDLIRDVGGC